jgi:hypothetical protein
MDTVFAVRVRSYGFLHPGRERLRTVLKQSWPFVPGSTLYGAVATALIRLDGVGDGPPSQGQGGYQRLLQLIAGQQSQVRFTPLLPMNEGTEITSAAAYCQLAREVYEQVEGRRPNTPPLFFTTPHAPLSRDTLQIHGDQLYAFSNHRADLAYAGFVFAPATWENDLRRALRLLPLLPFGGKGKFSMAEGEVAGRLPLDRFRADLRATVQATPEVWLLTPMILQAGAPNWLLEGATAVTHLPRLRRYRSWRTGAYYDFIRGEFDEFGIGPGEGEDDSQYGLPSGAESRAATGVPERSRFVLPAQPDLADKVTEAFIRGVGHPNWTYLGWGQVVVE